ncbi:hypothetical protein DID76_02580 [Candidatus Marinamargulisbacteria bacterium SCGC AG-414-C22]|nr:hypothetical protein DID76_02580 [Candidatus Marinamargulisbacteria bacterium SCGC AG-414-C22]
MNVTMDKFQTDYAAVFITDGLEHLEAVKRYRKRREALAKQYKGVIALKGLGVDLCKDKPWLMSDIPIFQEPFFLYLTGVNQLAVGFIIDNKGNHILFLPKYDMNKEFWEGKQLGYHPDSVDMLKQATGFDAIYAIDDYFSVLDKRLKTSSVTELHTMWYSSMTETGDSSQHFFSKFKQECKDFLKEKKYHNIQLNSIDYSDWNRLVLDDVDIDNMKKAIAITTDALRFACSDMSRYVNETQFAGGLRGFIHQHSWCGMSFPPIVAVGKNALALHYVKNNSDFNRNDLLLCDVGCRYHSVVSDISRTIPVNGIFNPLQRLLYQIVLDAQLLVQEHVRSGVTFNDLNELCWNFIEAALDVRFTSIGGVMTRLYQKQPHNVGHLLAHAVHDGDPLRFYRSRPLEAGMVITNEPGLYGHFRVTIDEDVYEESIGIRIEDNLLITETGCVNLSEECPKTIDDVEAMFVTSFG